MSEPGPDPILKTKLFIPRLRQRILTRARLIERMEAGVRGALTLVSAPAGFGKTTVLAEWAGQTALPVAWVSLDAEDSDPLRFLAYLTAALHQIGRAGTELLSLVRSGQTLPPQSILVRLLSDLETSPEPLAVVLEDYHAIQSPAVHAAVSFLLEHRPEPLRLVISTRADPPFPLARLRAGGELTEVRADDLRFTAEETSQFLHQTMGLAISPEDVAALEARTEGWIVGLQMAALSMRDRQDVSGFIRAFSGSHRFVLDYLAEEVISRQSPEIQKFLLRTSILDRMCGPLCEAVAKDEGERITDKEKASSLYPSSFIPSPLSLILDLLDRSNLFLIPLDDERKWYRYHHLFAELLRARLAQTDPGLVPELHRRAGRWFEQNGMVVEAVQHALEAKDFALAADWIERYGHELWASSDRTFFMLTGRLPLEMLQTRPALGIYHAWTLIMYARVEAGEALLRQVSPHLSGIKAGPERQAMQSFIDLLLMYIAALTGKQAEGSLPGREVLDFVPERQLGMRNTADVVYAILLSLRGEFDAVADLLFGTVRRDIAAGGTTAVPISIAFIARLYSMQGRLQDAVRLCRETIRIIEENGGWKYYLPGNLHIALGNLLRSENKLDEAEALVRKGIELNDAWNIPLANSIGWVGVARLQFAKGDVDGALETMAKLEQMNQGALIAPDMLDDQQALLVQLWLSKGDLERAGEWARGQSAGAPDYRHEQKRLSLARAALARGQLEEAEQLLARQRAAAKAGGRRGREIEIGLLLALTLQARNRQAEAFHELESCLAFAEPEGYVRLFLDEGTGMRDLLQAYLRLPKAAHKAFAQSLLDAFGEPVPSAGRAGAGELVEPLTPREAEVLRLVCEGLSNQEIAERLVITISAVKKHTGNIFGKLGVTSRTQAIARARQMKV